jgi:quercetin dioxygenase-like cupin family protein
MSINRSAHPGEVLPAGAGEAVTAAGVAITFKTTGAKSAGQFLTLEYTAPPRFSGPPPHWHKVTTEIFYVLEGSLTVTIDGQSTTVGPGGYAFVPPGVVHGFANQTDAPVRYFGIASPAGLEDYFAEMAKLIQDEPSWPPADMGKMVALMAKYDTFTPEARV